MECIQCIAKDANKSLFERDDLDHYERTLKRNTLKKSDSVGGLKRHDTARTGFSQMKESVSRSRLDESIAGRSVSFTEDKIGGAGSILANSINLDESVSFQREGHASGYSDARKPTHDEKKFFEGLKHDIETRADF